MARTYRVTFENVAVTLPQDLFEIVGASGKIVKIKRVAVSDVDTTAPTSQMLSLRCRLLPATVISGSGGSSPTPQKVDLGDAAASFTAKANSTTKATTGGTAVVIEENGCHIYSGFDYSFPTPPVVGNGESFVFELLSTVSGTVHLSGTIEAEEIGG